MVRSDLDWKNQPRNIVDWSVILIAVLLLAMQLYLWWINGQSQYLVMAMVFFAWLAIFFTDYWQPILYAIMAGLVVFILIFGSFGEFFERPVGQIAFLLHGVFLLVILYLYFFEEASQQKAKSNH